MCQRPFAHPASSPGIWNQPALGLRSPVVLRVFARSNYLVYAVKLWILALGPAMAEMLASGNTSLQAHGIATAAVMIASVLLGHLAGLDPTNGTLYRPVVNFTSTRVSDSTGAPFSVVGL